MNQAVRKGGKPGRPKGLPKTGGGSRKGIPNKVTKELKDMILGALDDCGGQAYLQRQAEANPSSFLSLIGRVLPTTVTGPDGGAIRHTVKVTFG